MEGLLGTESAIPSEFNSRGRGAAPSIMQVVPTISKSFRALKLPPNTYEHVQRLDINDWYETGAVSLASDDRPDVSSSGAEQILDGAGINGTVNGIEEVYERCNTIYTIRTNEGRIMLEGIY